MIPFNFLNRHDRNYGDSKIGYLIAWLIGSSIVFLISTFTPNKEATGAKTQKTIEKKLFIEKPEWTNYYFKDNNSNVFVVYDGGEFHLYRDINNDGFADVYEMGVIGPWTPKIFERDSLPKKNTYRMDKLKDSYKVK